jgi:D-tyrosyl-tRNA(Tyr) deacylase
VRVLLQRVSRARVTVDDDVAGQIGRGYLLFVGVGRDDPDAHVRKLAAKVAGLRVFPDAEGRVNLSLADVGGEALVVSQFTLYGDVRKGRRPSWIDAEDPERADAMVEAFARELEGHGYPVSRGRFGAHMEVELVNDGPLTLWLDAEAI